MVEKQRELQKEVQKDMSAIQLNNMILGQERMRRMMIAQQMAIARERLIWIGAFGGFLTLGLTGYTVRTKSFPAPAMVPLIGYWTIFAYQWDFAYGNKAQRIFEYQNSIMQDNRYWFNPVLPDKLEVVTPPPSEEKKA